CLAARKCENATDDQVAFVLDQRVACPAAVWVQNSLAQCLPTCVIPCSNVLDRHATGARELACDDQFVVIDKHRPSDSIFRQACPAQAAAWVLKTCAIPFN